MPSKFDNSDWLRHGDPLGARGDVLGYQRRRAPKPQTETRRRGNRRRIPFIVVLNARLRLMRNIVMVLFLIELVVLANISPTFLVRNVHVIGTTLRTPKEIARQGQLDQSVKIWQTAVTDSERRILLFPEVASVSVVRRIPSTLIVTVRERVPAGVVLIGSQCIVIDKDAIAFRDVPSPPPVLNIVRLTAPVKPVLGQPLPAPAMRSILKCLAAIPEAGLGAETRLVMDNRQCLVGYTSDGMVFRLGPVDNALERLTFLTRLLKGKQGPALRAKAQVIDVTTPGGEIWIPRQAFVATRLQQTPNPPAPAGQ